MAADGVDFDFSQLNSLAAHLAEVPAELNPLLRKALAVTARNVKDGWNEKLYRDGHANRTGRSITYDVNADAGGVSAEIGAERGAGKQAGIVLLLEYGSANNPPHGAGHGALDENRADFVTGIGKAGEDALNGALGGAL